MEYYITTLAPSNRSVLCDAKVRRCYFPDAATVSVLVAAAIDKWVSLIVDGYEKNHDAKSVVYVTKRLQMFYDQRAGRQEQVAALPVQDQAPLDENEDGVRGDV